MPYGQEKKSDTATDPAPPTPSPDPTGSPVPEGAYHEQVAAMAPPAAGVGAGLGIPGLGGTPIWALPPMKDPNVEAVEKYLARIATVARQTMTMAAATSMVLSNVPEAQKLTTPELQKLLRSWAVTTGRRLTSSGGPPKVTQADVEAKVSGGPGSTEVKWYEKAWEVIKKGPNLSFQSGAVKGQVGGFWTGTVGLRAQSHGVHFAAEVGAKDWTISISFPGDIHMPQLALLPEVVNKGYEGITRIASEAQKLGIKKATELPDKVPQAHMTAAKNAITQLWQVYSVATAPKPGGITGGVTVTGPLGNQAGPQHSGISAVATITFWF